MTLFFNGQDQSTASGRASIAGATAGRNRPHKALIARRDRRRDRRANRAI